MRHIESEQPQNQDVLTRVIEEYKRGPLTPELVTNYWRAKLQVDGARAGLNIVVPDCDWSTEEIQRPMVDIEDNPVSAMMVYKPEQIRGKEGLILLGKMYPKMASYSARGNTPIADTYETTGWIKVEAIIDAPNRNTRKKDLDDFSKKQGYLWQREGTYILASHASKDLTGRFLDQGGTRCRLLESRAWGGVVGPVFDSGEYLGVLRLLVPWFRYQYLGGRFEEVKKT